MRFLTLPFTLGTLSEPMVDKELSVIPIKARVPATPRWDVVIDPSQGRGAIIKQMHDACSMFSRIELAGKNVLYIIARYAIEVREHEWFAPKYGSFTQFVEAEIIEKHGISSGGIWGQIGVYGPLPEVTIEQANAIGTQKLLKAAIAKKRDPTIPSQKLLKDAETLTIDQLEEKYPIIRDGRSPGYDVERIVTNKKWKREFRKWCGSVDPAKAIKWAMEKLPEGPPQDL